MSALIFKRRDLPEAGDLVVARVTKVFEYGAYATLEEFENLTAFIPWSEVSTRWIRNIRDVLREGQIVVGKVIRVDKKKRPPQIDISLKRVSDGERRFKMMRWKRDQRAQKIIELAAKKYGKSLEEARNEVWEKLRKRFADVLSILEQAVIQGPKILKEAGLSEEWSKIIHEEASRHIEVKHVKIRGIITAQSFSPDGANRIKKFLQELMAIELPNKHTNIKVYTIGAPRYVVEVTALDYKTAEKVLKTLLNKAEKLVKELGLENYSFTRVEVGRA
ncbi:MAG: translation initiation factor IF-2 subunit alpha [Thermoprotei archaeon]|nr:MAG: translation initiation factor IF-2 subunit alpha [Thermoprotei archaeon]